MKKMSQKRKGAVLLVFLVVLAIILISLIYSCSQRQDFFDIRNISQEPVILKKLTLNDKDFITTDMELKPVADGREVGIINKPDVVSFKTKKEKQYIFKAVIYDKLADKEQEFGFTLSGEDSRDGMYRIRYDAGTLYWFYEPIIDAFD